jgi:Uma2 family endonuclease
VELSQFDIVHPDLLVVPRQSARQVSPSRILGAPDLVVEILSEHSATRDRELKLGAYERTGVREYWIVDTEAHAVDRYVRSGDRLQHTGRHTDTIEYRTADIAALVDLTTVW